MASSIRIQKPGLFRVALTLCMINLIFTAHIGSTRGEESFSVFMIGDSTMADKPVVPENPERGWGQLLRLYFKSHVTIENHAVNGRSSRSFINEGRWENVLSKIAPGDWVIIQFGHNDQKPDEARHTDPFSSYTDNLRRFVRESRECGATPVLATPIVRRIFNDDDGKLVPTHGDYPAAVRKLAESDNVPLIELNNLSRALIEKLGDERSRPLFVWSVPGEYLRFPDGSKDNTHFTALGATRICDLAVSEIILKIPDLARHLDKN